ncbi:MAG: hypothetical protein WC998_02660 [Candidatus Paceibacterota bacterium]|jgi:cytochrome bd-type quinol oxidase subunit 1
MKETNDFSVLAIILMVAAIIFGLAVTNYTYQYGWSMNYAQKHLSIAKGSADVEIQYAEISKAIEILQVFPKEGNYDYLNNVNPSTDMKTGWSSLYQLQNYTNEIRLMDKSSPAYQQGVRNIQERIASSYAVFEAAANSFIGYELKGWVIMLACVVGLVGFIIAIFCLLINFVSYNHESPLVKAILFLTALSIVAVFLGWIYVQAVPIFYTGPV